MTGNRRTAVATIGTYLHFGIVAGILLVSLGLGGVIERLGHGEATSVFSWIAITGGIVLFLATAAAYASVARAADREKKNS